VRTVASQADARKAQKTVNSIVASFCGKGLKEVMPEQIDSPTPKKVPAGKTHDFPHPLPVPGAVAMNRAMLADRFRIEGTAQPPGQGVGKKPTTVSTKPVPLQAKSLKSGLVRFEVVPRALIRMMGSAIYCGKKGQNLEVLAFPAGQCRSLISGSVHGNQYRRERKEGALTEVKLQSDLCVFKYMPGI
jgi:hypothetical protein